MTNSEWLDIDQNTDHWLDLRAGRIGGSTIGKIMANAGKAFGNPAHDAALQIVLEQLTGNRTESYTNVHMERGHEQEPIARALYEEKTFTDVTNGGYYISGHLLGCSPDGLVNNDGLIEIKSVISSVHFATIKRNKFDPKYKWQLIYNLGVSGRDWIDYVEYCAEFPQGKQLFVQRLKMEDYMDELSQIAKRLIEFGELLKEKDEIIRSIK